MNDQEETRILAIIGVITGGIGTLTGITALTWDIIKWRKSERVKLSIRVKPGILYTNEGNVPETIVEISNVGQVQTTIRHVPIEIYKGRFWRELQGTAGSFSNFTNPTPHCLDKGMYWTGSRSGVSDDIFDEFQDGTPYVCVYHSHSEKPVKVKLPKITKATRTPTNAK